MVRRGIAHIRVPTTLVGQIDAGVGLKTGVNFCAGKNYLGSFHPPERVLVDPTFLGTLPARELRQGLAEMVKIALVRDPALFATLEEWGLRLLESRFRDPAAVAEHAKSTAEPIAAVWARVHRYVREIVPSFNAYIYFRVGYTVSRAIARLLYRVRIGFADEPALRAIAPRSTLVFVINHRSNMDYILVSFLAAERVTLSYAVGEWARVWGLQQLIRAMGAFFVRRNSGDPLYRVVLARYVQMATEGGVTQAMFPEGGLTLDGRLRTPRFGLLAYILLGTMALKRGETRNQRAVFLILALAAYAYIVGVALTRNPLPL